MITRLALQSPHVSQVVIVIQLRVILLPGCTASRPQACGGALIYAKCEYISLNKISLILNFSLLYFIILIYLLQII